MSSFFFFSWRYEGIYKVSRAPFKHLHRTMPMERKDTRTFTHWSKSKNNTVINKDRFCRDNRGTEGRQAGTMLKGVCSWAHKRTHSTDVFWDNTGFNIEHLKQLNKKKKKKRNHCTGRSCRKPTPPRGVSAGLRYKPEPEAQRWRPLGL